MRVLSLFSGIGAHDLGLVWAGMTIVGQVEIDEYCRGILTKHWPDVPKWKDIKTVSIDDIRSACGHIDLITGGFPCQDISTAGKGAGIHGARSGLFWEMLRVIKGIHPPWLLLENVPALRTRGADEILESLEECRYTPESFVVGAVHVGAWHRRNRVLIVAHANSPGRNIIGNGGVCTNGITPCGCDVNGCDREKSRTNTNVKPAAAGPVERGRAVVATEQIGKELGGDGAGSDTIGNTIREQPILLRGRDSSPIFGVNGDGVGPNAVSEGHERLRRTWPGRFAKSPYGTQHEWEYPRTTLVPVGRSIYGNTRRMAIKAIGNSNPPQLFALFGRAITKVNELSP